jgi:uncharacterized protein involved in type VI secretion and phage assembly
MLDVVNGQQQAEVKARGAKGPVIATVTNNSDPSGLGKVKLKYEWLSGTNETDWVRVAPLMAGDKAGTFCIPEVGTHVVVIFLFGDINQPIVIGSLWTDKNKAPYVNENGKNNIKMIRTRTGHEIVFDDTSQKEQIRIHTHAGQEIVMDDTSGATKIIIKDANNKNSIEIDSKSGSILLSSVSNITLKSANINIEGSVGVNIKAPVITNDASGSLTSKSARISNEGGNFSCNVSGPLVLKGSQIAMG